MAICPHRSRPSATECASPSRAVIVEAAARDTPCLNPLASNCSQETFPDAPSGGAPALHHAHCPLPALVAHRLRYVIGPPAVAAWQAAVEPVERSAAVSSRCHWTALPR
jgi:hypothetical protein